MGSDAGRAASAWRSTSHKKKDHGWPLFIPCCWAWVNSHDLPYFTCASSYPLFAVTPPPCAATSSDFAITRLLHCAISPPHHSLPCTAPPIFCTPVVFSTPLTISPNVPCPMVQTLGSVHLICFPTNNHHTPINVQHPGPERAVHILLPYLNL